MPASPTSKNPPPPPLQGWTSVWKGHPVKTLNVSTGKTETRSCKSLQYLLAVVSWCRVWGCGDGDSRPGLSPGSPVVPAPQKSGRQQTAIIGDHNFQAVFCFVRQESVLATPRTLVPNTVWWQLATTGTGRPSTTEKWAAADCNKMRLQSLTVSQLFSFCNAVLPGPDKHSRLHSPKTTAIFEAFTATYKKICCCMLFQSTTTKRNKKT